MSATCRPRTARSIPNADFHMIWEVDAKAQKRLTDIARAVKGADKLILATDPDREGEAISWHVLRGAEGKEGAEGPEDRARGVQRHHQAGGHRGDEASARRSTARWSMPIWRAARSTIWSASRSRRCCGASCPARARPAACSRSRCGSSATASSRSRNSSRANTGRWSRRSRRRATRPSKRASSAPTARRSSASTSAPAPRPKPSSATLETAQFSRRLGRGEARQAQSRRRPSPPRPCSRRRAASSASRPRTRCGSRSGSMKASTSAARPSASSPICAPTACRSRPRRSPRSRSVIGRTTASDYVPDAPRALPDQGQERAGSARSDPPDRRRPPPARRRQISSIPTRPSSTS